MPPSRFLAGKAQSHSSCEQSAAADLKHAKAPLGLGESRSQRRIGCGHGRPCLGTSRDTFAVTVVLTGSSTNSLAGRR